VRPECFLSHRPAKDPTEIIYLPFLCTVTPPAVVCLSQRSCGLAVRFSGGSPSTVPPGKLSPSSGTRNRRSSWARALSPDSTPTRSLGP
jgi:hypothetical protein